MMVLVSYDVSTLSKEGRSRLRRIAKSCVNRGQRVQHSVFECDVDPAQWAELKANLLDIYNPREDSLRFYFLGSNWQQRVEHLGAKPSVDFKNDTLLI